MPVPPGTRYRWKKYPSGKKVRLAFKGNKVVEAKSYEHVTGGKTREKAKKKGKMGTK